VRRELVAACIGESQRARLKAENESLLAMLDAVRDAVGPLSAGSDPSEAVKSLRTRLDEVERALVERSLSDVQKVRMRRAFPLMSRRRAVLHRVYRATLRHRGAGPSDPPR
jgi:hypothetical protein